MGETCDGMRALGGKLNHLALDCAPAKSTAVDALRDINEVLFRDYYFSLIKFFHKTLSVSRKNEVSFKEFYAFDSTTITLFSQVMKGVGRNTKGAMTRKKVG